MTEARARCSDASRIQAVLKRHVKEPHGFKYTTELDGPPDYTELEEQKNMDMLDDVRENLHARCCLEQGATAAALLAIAKDKEAK